MKEEYPNGAGYRPEVEDVPNNFNDYIELQDRHGDNGDVFKCDRNGHMFDSFGRCEECGVTEDDLA